MPETGKPSLQCPTTSPPKIDKKNAAIQSEGGTLTDSSPIICNQRELSSTKPASSASHEILFLSHNTNITFHSSIFCCFATSRETLFLSHHHHANTTIKALYFCVFATLRETLFPFPHPYPSERGSKRADSIINSLSSSQRADSYDRIRTYLFARPLPSSKPCPSFKKAP